jgi:hypothetical protein
MVGHEAIVVYGDVMVSGIQAHQLFEVFVVFFVFEHYSLFDSTIDNVVEAVDLYAGFSGHGRLLYSFEGSIAQERLGYCYHLTPIVSGMSTTRIPMAAAKDTARGRAKGTANTEARVTVTVDTPKARVKVDTAAGNKKEIRMISFVVESKMRRSARPNLRHE